MTQSAKVVRLLDKGMAQVAAERTSACGESCAMCGASCAFKKSLTVTARNNIAAREGDMVVISTKSSRIFFAAFVVYIIPFILFFAGYGASAVFGAEESVSILVSVGAFLIGALVAILYNRTVGKRRGFEFEITAFAKQEK